MFACHQTVQLQT